MIVKDSKGREVEIGGFHGRDRDDIQIGEAAYTDDGSDVSDDEMEHIYDAYASEIDQAWYENQMDAAEAFYEGER